MTQYDWLSSDEKYNASIKTAPMSYENKISFYSENLVGAFQPFADFRL